MTTETQTQTSLIEKLMDLQERTLTPHEMARELTNLYGSCDAEGLKKLRDAYLVGLARLYPERDIDGLRNVVDGNMLDSAGLADIVASDGYEASGQLHAKLKFDRPIARFYQLVTGHIPK